MERARRSVALARAVEPCSALGILVIHLINGQRLVLPIEHLQGLTGASPQQLRNHELCSSGVRLTFPDVNAQFWVPGLARGVYGSRRWMDDLKKRLNSPPAQGESLQDHGGFCRRDTPS